MDHRRKEISIVTVSGVHFTAGLSFEPLSKVTREYEITEEIHVILPTPSFPGDSAVAWHARVEDLKTELLRASL